MLARILTAKPAATFAEYVLRGHRIDAGECMHSMTEARARQLEGLGHQWRRCFPVSRTCIASHPGPA
jgi:hypothetical protein